MLLDPRHQPTIDDIRNELARRDNQGTHLDVAFQDLALTPTGMLQIDGEHYRLAINSKYNLAKTQDIPTNFADQISDELFATIFNQLQEDTPKFHKSRLNIKGSIITHLSNPHLLEIPYSPILEEVCNGLESASGLRVEDYQVARFDVTDELLNLQLHTPEIDHEVREGDLLHPGISVIHSPSGKHPTQIMTYIQRLVCQNGMTVRVCEDGHRLRIRRLAKDGFSVQQVLDQVKKIAGMASADFQAKLQAFAALRDTPIPKIETALRLLAARLRLGTKKVPTLVDGFYRDELGVEENGFGLVNAISRFATHQQDLPFRQRTSLMEAAGDLSQSSIHQCKECESILN